MRDHDVADHSASLAVADRTVPDSPPEPRVAVLVHAPHDGPAVGRSRGNLDVPARLVEHLARAARDLDRLEVEEVAPVVRDRQDPAVGQPAHGDVLHLALVSGQVDHLAGLDFDRKQILVGVLCDAHGAQPAAVGRPAAGDVPCRLGHQQSLLFAVRVHHGEVDVRVVARVGADHDRVAIRRDRVA